MTERDTPSQTTFQIDLAVGVVLAAIALAVIISLINSGASTQSASLLIVGSLIGAIVPPMIAVVYVWKRHPNVSNTFLWIYAALTFAMLLAASVVSGFTPFSQS